MHCLKIKILDDCPDKEFVQKFYQTKANAIQYKKDCGIDIIFPTDVEFLTNKVTKCNMGISCEFIPSTESESSPETESGPFDLVPRSSIAATPLMLANSIGIFDPEYRGPLIAAFRCFVDRDHQSTVDDFIYRAKKGDRLVQVVAPDRKPIKVEVVEKLTETARGSNGFGSTN